MKLGTEQGLRMSERCTPALDGRSRGPRQIVHEERGAALIIAVAIFVVLLFIGLTFYSQARLELRTATNNQDSFRTDMINSAGTAIAVAQLRLDKRQHPTATSLDHGWNTLFNGAWLAGKPWAFRQDSHGIRVLDQTWTSWAGIDPRKRVPYIDYWADVKVLEAELARVTYNSLNGVDLDGNGVIEPDEVDQGLGSALAAIKNPLWVPRYQFDPNDRDNSGLDLLLDADWQGSIDWPVQYAYDFSNYNVAFNTPTAIPNGDYDPFDAAWPARVTTPQQKINAFADVDSDNDGLRDAMWLPIAIEIFFGGIDRNADGRVGAGYIEIDIDNDGDVDVVNEGSDDEGGDGIDNDLDGIVDEQDEVALFVYWGGNDGKDNDGDHDPDGLRSDGVDSDNDGAIDEGNGGNEGIDEPDEQRVFLTAPIIADSYWGGNDGADNNGSGSDNIDNDGDGLVDEAGEGIDEPDEQRIFLTADDRIDNDGDVDFDDPGESIPLLNDFIVRINLRTLNEFIGPFAAQFTSDTDTRLQVTNPGDPFGVSVDRLDNDFTQIINDVHGHAYYAPDVPELVDPGDPTSGISLPWLNFLAAGQQNRARSYSTIHTGFYPVSGAIGSIPGLAPVLTASGESVCEIAGRVAIHIVDEASKVNLNNAGAIATVVPQENPGASATDGFIYSQHRDQFTFARNEGSGSGEYETRVLPIIGIERALDIAMTRDGEHKGPDAGSGKPQNFPLLNPLDDNDSDDDGTIDNPAEAGYAYDLYFPGFGRADDNANALQLQFDGLDNDGDGMYYVYDGVDNDGDTFTDEPDEASFGIDEPFEGIDEPAELQSFRPLRHRIAELDGVDNDGDGAIDEIGELGDRLYHTGDEMQGALALASNQTGVGFVAPLRSIVTVQSTDPNARYQRYVRDGNGDFARNIPPDTAPVTGMKLDLNYALASSIAPALREDWSYPATNELLLTEAFYPPDLGNAALSGNPYLIATSNAASFATNEDDYEAQFVLEAAYVAGLRHESVTRVDTPIGVFDARHTNFTNPNPPGKYLEADAGLRAYQLALNITDARDTDRVRNTETYRQGDDWWSALVRDPALPITVPTPIVREITYEFAGAESIRINELMVRAVRRVEAESNYENTTHPENNTELMSDGVALDFDVVSDTNSLSTTDPTQGWVLFPETVPVGPGITSGFITETAAVDTEENVLQFLIGPSAQLPPGRYYLMVNTIGEDGLPSVEDATDIEYRVKYVRTVAGEPDILADLATLDPFGANLIATTVQADPAIGSRNGANAFPATVGDESGLVFLPTVDLRVDPATLPLGAAAYAGIPDEAGLQNEAFTVIIPPYAATTTEQYYLCVAISANASALDPIAINFLDFSQEPDHEWIEIVNVSESRSAIDLSGWLLEVGGGTSDLSNTIFTIPNGTSIAPNGSLLLTANKYDQNTVFFADNADATALFSKNGISMTNVPLDPIANPTVIGAGTSEAPIPRYAARGEAGFASTIGLGTNTWTGQWGVPVGSAAGAESIFQRATTAVDFVDRDGDGAAEVGTVEDAVVSTFEGATPAGDKPWDRIVQLIPPLAHPLNLRNSALPLPGTTAGDRLDVVAEMVLRGGILPNNPDFDLVDNDNDNAELMRDSVDNNGNRNMYVFDGLDNDGDGTTDDADEWNWVDNDGIDNEPDGLTDEGSDGIDNDGDSLIDELDELELIDELDEGVDEGNPFSALGVPKPGSFDRFSPVFVNATEPGYVRGVASYPEWKNFVERRFYPGDNVRVTLYRGFPEEAYAVDRVTYNQNDVENRAPDDVRRLDEVITTAPPDYLTRFRMLDGNTGGAISRAWPENTMGLDFYRSLERKHPLYAGDRFGLANRWTATDGNYDDWGHGTNRWFFDNVTAGSSSMLSELQFDDVINGTTVAVSGALYFGHGLSGSPLRANYFQRVLEDPRLQHPSGPDQPLRLVSNDAPVTEDPLVGDNTTLLSRARVRDANFRSPGDLMTVPHLTLTRSYQLGNYDLLGREALQGSSVLPEDFIDGGTPSYVKGASIGTDYPEDLRALLDIASQDSISLNVGQANFYPLYPYVQHLTADNTLVEWEASSNDFRGPRAWSPVFLTSLDPNGSEPESADFTGTQTITISQTGTPQFPHLQLPDGTPIANYPMQMAFIYRNTDLSRVPPFGNTQWLLQENATGTSDASVRWPLERRAMMYVSSNPDGFDPNLVSHQQLPPVGINDIHPSEALFVWDGADGLPNGEYDVYVVTMPDTSNLIESTRRFDANREDWLPEALERARRQLPIDIMFLTDKDGDRKVWMDQPGNAQAGLPDTVELGFNSQDAAIPREKYPLKAGLEPSSDGIVHYGVVKVENNYLAMFARNWAVPGVSNVNAVSRVVLMTRDRTPGRINVNTAITQPIAENTTVTPDFHAFNPMAGLIGMMAEYAPGALDTGTFIPTPWGDADNIGTGPPYTFVLGQWYARAMQRSNQLVLSRGQRFVDYNNNGVIDTLDPQVRYDGRYLLSAGELVVSGDESAFESRPLVTLPDILLQYDVGVVTPNGKAQAFDELKERYARMANNVTTVSDTFEIFVTAQSGSAFDANRDGIINWRDDSEFLVTGEKRSRTVYER
ncbi:MAG: lamin tail domain-containing protein [Candidatus Hydrogenedentes bacterium]|nr:lamin tail domain-containing protein [Candidatus Hydrogenedentota bacterium]